MNKRWLWAVGLVVVVAGLGWLLWTDMELVSEPLAAASGVGSAAARPTSSDPTVRRSLPTRSNGVAQDEHSDAGYGQVVGRMLWHGQPVGGLVELQPVDVSKRESGWHPSRHTGKVPASGAFELKDVAPGRWSMRVIAMADGARTELVLDEVSLAAQEHLNLGDIEVGGTGGMSGRVVTQPDSDSVVTVVFAEPASSDTLGARTQDFVSFPGAQFSLDGLSPGSWRVWDARDPASAVEVAVLSGENTDGVEIVEPEHWAQPDLGCAFDLQMATPYAVVTVASVAPGGPADRAGLRQGDTVVRVEPGTHDEASGKGEPATDAAEGLFAFTLSGDNTALVTVLRDGGEHQIRIP